MNLIKSHMKLLFIALIASLSATSCQDKYPDLQDGLYAEIVTTKGTMVAQLFYDKVPVTVANFVGLAEGTHPQLPDSLKGKPFYNGITFHRVMDKFMIQGGDPTGTGRGSAGYRFHSEFDKDLRHNKPGILSMANSGGLATNGTQFFITEVPYPSLDAFDANGNVKACDQPRVSCHGVFGELVKGIEVQDSISNVKVGTGNKPLEDVIINKVNIIRKGADAKAFDAVKVFTTEEPLLSEKFDALKTEAESRVKEEAKKAAEVFKTENKDLEGELIESPTGLVMILNKAKNGKTPKNTEKVLIHSTGYFVNGDLFYTTQVDVAKKFNQYNENAEKNGAYKPFAMIYNESATLVPGFREAMLKMNVGDKARIFVPSYLGYGPSGRRPRIPPNTNLVFDLELVGIE